MKLFLCLYSVLFVSVSSFSMLEENPKIDKATFSSRVKLALRQTGNSLLLQSKDSTSLVLPVTETRPNVFQLTFQMELPIIPDSLVAAVEKNFKALNLPSDYLVEVVDCSNLQVNYSYAISNHKESNIVPCLGRNLPVKCYKINVTFPNIPEVKESTMSTPWYTLVLFGVLGIGLFFWVRYKGAGEAKDALAYAQIGSYAFYEDQNKLVKDGANIKLTAKETELLKIFSDNLNQVVSRDELLKEVWEDKGVFVGRSLDTFISKLRKKFKDDGRIHLINLHGVGYKLEFVKGARK